MITYLTFLFTHKSLSITSTSSFRDSSRLCLFCLSSFQDIPIESTESCLVPAIPPRFLIPENTEIIFFLSTFSFTAKISSRETSTTPLFDRMPFHACSPLNDGIRLRRSYYKATRRKFGPKRTAMCTGAPISKWVEMLCIW